MDGLSIHAYNLRQYNHMDSLLDKFMADRLLLGKLVDTLDPLFAHSKMVDEAWDSEFEKGWK